MRSWITIITSSKVPVSTNIHRKAQVKNKKAKKDHVVIDTLLQVEQALMN
jgi:hypothetical protein